MSKLIRRVLMAVAGLAVMLAWFTFKPSRGGEAADHLPAKVWEGGAATLTIEVETSAAATVTAVFETNGDLGDASHRILETHQTVPAGKHRFEIDVPANVGGSVFARVDEPSVGEKVSLALSTPAGEFGRDEAALTEPLREGEGFGAGLEVENYARGALED